MLDLDMRTAILTLHRQGHGVKRIARTLGVSKNTVKRVVRSGQAEVPLPARTDQATAHLARIREIYAECQGNRVRLWEDLRAEGIELPYATLTAAMRRHGIGVKEKTPAGEYRFAPGQEMQHDTSPHDPWVGGRKRRAQCTGLWLGYSRMRFFQYYPTFNRFYCKVFHTEAARYLEGVCARNTVDNTSVVVASGTGKSAVIAPEMAAFAQRFGFTFMAHEKGDVNRSAGVERGFHIAENNFLVRRRFDSFEHLNREARAFSERLNATYRRDLKASPLDLWRQERPHLRPLPLHIPEVYRLHTRTVDLCGYVHVDTNRYSVPPDLIGREVEVRESLEAIRVFHRHQLVATHGRREEGTRARVTLPEHRVVGRYRHRKRNPPPTPEERVLRAAPAKLGEMVDAIKRRRGGRAVRPIRELHRLYLEYPEAPLLAAVADALRYGLIDTTRLEDMVLRNLAGTFFRLPEPPDPDNDTEETPDEQ